MNSKQMDLDASGVIDGLGGTGETAELCEVSPSAVSQWRNTGIPKAQLKYIKLARPDLFPKPRKPTRRPLAPP